jgi:hypothetical protein
MSFFHQKLATPGAVPSLGYLGFISTGFFSQLFTDVELQVKGAKKGDPPRKASGQRSMGDGTNG